MATDERLDRLESQAAPLLPLVLEQRPGKVLAYDPVTNYATWIWQTYDSDAVRVNHPNGLIGTPTFMPAIPLGNGDFTQAVLPMEVWARKRLSTDLGPVHEFDWNCCPVPTPGSGAGCCGTTDNITLSLDSDCGCSGDVTMTWDADAQRWKGCTTCTLGGCTATICFFLQCYSCDDPPRVPDYVPDCNEASYFYILTWWVTYSGDSCPSSTYGVVTWTSDEVQCDPFALSEKTFTIGDCTFTVNAGVFPPSCVSYEPYHRIATATVTNKTGMAVCLADSLHCFGSTDPMFAPMRFSAISAGGDMTCEGTPFFELTCPDGVWVLSTGSPGVTITLVSSDAALKILVYDIDFGTILGTPPPPDGTARITLQLANP